MWEAIISIFYAEFYFVIIPLAVFFVLWLAYRKLPAERQTSVRAFITSKNWKGILIIGGIILALWLWSEYDKNNEVVTEKKVENICNVIIEQQPNNWKLYDICYDKGMEEFGRDTTSPSPND